MAQIITLPRKITFTRAFEELPLFSERTASGDWFFAGLLDGTMDVSFDSTGDWWISNITIEIENFKMGAGNRSKTVEINGDDHPSLYYLLLDVLTDKYAGTIAEWIAFEMEEAA